MMTSMRIRANSRTLLDIDNFEIAENQISFLFGESGIGKSIFAKTLFGLSDANLLKIKINDRSYSEYKQSDACKNLVKNGFIVFQEPSTHMNPVRSIANQLAEGALDFTPEVFPFLNLLWKKNSESVLRELVSLYPRPYRPSGGEKQRILIGMAFKKLQYLENINESPSLFVFDEPTGNLDDAYRDLFLMQLLSLFKQKPFTILFVTHDYSIISRISSHHPDLISHIRYFEAHREGTRTKVTSFSEMAYIKWLKSLSPISAQEQMDSRTLLQVESRIRIFDRNLHVRTKEAAHLKVRKGEMIYLRAESGTGKTTLAKVVMGLLQPDYLSMVLCGKRFTEKSKASDWKRYIWGRKAAMVFQHADEALNLKSTVRGVFDGLPRKFRPSDVSLLSEIQEFFDKPVSTEFLDQKVDTLSGGQKQRINLLRALLPTPELLILDEPFNGLDLNSLKKIIPYLLKKQKTGTGILLISHNEEIVNRFIPESNRYTLIAE